MRDTPLAECVLIAAQDYLEARRAHDDARDKFHASGGHSWGYFGDGYVNAMTREAIQFEDYLTKLIDARVVAAIREKLEREDQAPA